MKKQSWVVLVVLAMVAATSVHAQEVTAAFGVGTVLAPSAASASGNYSSQSLSGGAYPAFSGDFLFHKNFGVMGEVAWRASQNFYQGNFPFRPIFWDFNGLYAPKFGTKAQGDFTAGIGAESIRFYQPFVICNGFSCTNYTSSNHFLGHFGAGIRYYFHGGAFIRPEAHLYLIHNNFEFSSGHATRVGASLGYTFGGR